MNLGTFVVLAVVAVFVILDIRYLAKNGIDSCSGNCSGCGTSCKWVNDMNKARKHIERQRKIRKFFHMEKA